ncbi:MAG TPA: GNAT family N-acyltransferase [Flavobacteriales bacterium]|nr:GNAT family N-acyltransferase [Flavobacteriales bacterium]
MADLSNIIDPIDRSLLEKELNRQTFVRYANNGNNEIYIINCHNAPHTLNEIGRLREITFRVAGGGTGLESDLDEYDIAPIPYEQLIVWSPDDKEIVGGYRFIQCEKVNVEGNVPALSTSELFTFSEKFITEFLPYTIELGRSFVQPNYQPSATNRKGLFSLDNLWDGLGALVVDNPHIKYFFGKVTMYPDFNRLGRDMILHFMNHYFPDPDKLLWPIPSLHLKIEHDMSAFEKELNGLSYKDGHHVLNRHIRAMNENIPPLINAYMNLSPTMRNFGTSLNDHFGEVEETGILQHIPDIYPTKKERHIQSYLEEKAKR